jgi:protein-tyrosine phosphatase
VSYRVCFVCSGNICRSPVAEAVLRHRLADAGIDGLVEVDSAGTGGWHVGQDADPRALESLTRRGYHLAHVARQFDVAWFAERDLVLALDRGHLRELLRLAPDEEAADKVRLLRSFDPALDDAPESALDVPDPYYGGREGFDLVLDQVEAAVAGLLDHLRGELEVPQDPDSHDDDSDDDTDEDSDSALERQA